MQTGKSENLYRISDAQRAEFWRDGHILLRGVASQFEIELFEPIIKKACEKFNTETRNLAERDTYGKAFLQTMNLWRRDAEVEKFVFNNKFAQIAADLLGVEKVRLYHDQALFKEPGGGPTPWHRDQYYWPLETDKTVTMWMPLVDIDEEMGMLTFASGSHHFETLEGLRISDESAELFERFVAENDFPIQRAEMMRAGDATFHLGRTLHTAGANRAPEKMREVMTIIYFADGTVIGAPENENQQADLETWLGGKGAGELADSDLNPILN